MDVPALAWVCPYFSPMQGFTRGCIAATVDKRCGIVNLHGQSVNQRHLDAFCDATAYEHALAGWGRPLGALAGLGMAWRGRKIYRFPFLVPDAAVFEPRRFGGVLAMNRAVRAWHGCRAGAYVLLGWFVGGKCFQLAGMVWAARLESKDERLDDLRATEAPIGWGFLWWIAMAEKSRFVPPRSC